MESIFDPNPGCRSEAEWRRMLGGLVESLSAHVGVRFTPTSWFIEDHPGYASSGGCVDVRGPVSPALRLEACGVICISVNHGQSVRASADVLLFSGGRRVFGPGGSEVLRFQFSPDGWSDHGWVDGECGEWEVGPYPTDARWRKAEPDAAADDAGR